MGKGRAVHEKTSKRSATALPAVPDQVAPVRAIGSRKNLILIVALLLVASIGVRVWYSRRPLPPLSNSVRDIERRARDEPGSIAAQIDWGIALRQQGRLDEADSAFAAASRINPEDARPYTGLALVAMARNQPARAAEYYREALKHAPADINSWRGLAALYELLNQQTDAIAAYEKLLQLNPNDANAARQLGTLYTRHGQVFRAHDLLVRAARLNPTDVRTQRYLGENAFLQGRFPESREALEKVLAQEPDNPAVLSMLAQLIVKLDPSPEG